MPTAYNYKIVEGEQSFSGFVWHCARAMNPLFHMREDANDAPLRFPDPLPRGARNNAEITVVRTKEFLDEEQADLDTEEVKTQEEVEAEYVAHKFKQMAEYEERYARVKPINERVLRMRAEVADWQLPSEDHERLKGFMIEVLDMALKHEGKFPEKPEFPKTAAEWHSDDVEWQRDLVIRLKREYEEALDEANSPSAWRGNRAWLEDLIASVPPPPGSFEE